MLRIILEVGPKRRVVGGAMDWPGLDRWGASEAAALEKLAAYVPRYEAVARHAGLLEELRASSELEVVERVPGSSSTDFWGIAHVPSSIEREPLSDEAFERRLAILQACWATFDEVAAAADPALLPSSSRSEGRDRDTIVRHVYGSEPQQLSRKVEVRTPLEDVRTPEGRAAHRQAYLAALRAYHAAGKPARTWPLAFLIRRTAHHLMDHAWEIEDRDPTGD